MTTTVIPYKSDIEEVRNTLKIKEAEPLSLRLSTALNQIGDDIEKYLMTPESRVVFDSGVWCEISERQCHVCLAGIGMLTGRFGPVELYLVSPTSERSGLVTKHVKTAEDDNNYGLMRGALNKIRVGSSTQLYDALTSWRQLLESHIPNASNKDAAAELAAIYRAIGAYKNTIFREPNDWADMIREIYEGFKGSQDLPQLRALAEHFEQNGF